ncbi:Regulation of nuclear pre-mRNA domain-containing protein 1B [Linum grandiflorum]
MGSSFNPQILVEKLTKLNNSQASIETLSHWCIFHMHKAKHVVETWARQFHSSPREQRLAFLYLANDILQNSRRKGSEFVGEFWKVLPEALRDVIDHGDEFGRNSAMRLIGIWEERKVFGSRGQVLKEELLGRQLENSHRNGKNLDSTSKLELRHPIGSTVDKIVSGYHVVYSGKDEDAILGKCSSSISFFEKVDKEARDNNSGKVQGPAFVEEVQGQYVALRDSIDQLAAIESSKASLVSHLREALQEQETKLQHIRHQLQVARSQSETADNLRQQLVQASNTQSVTEQNSKEGSNSVASQGFVSGDREQTAPSMYTRQVSSHIEEDPAKSAAAAIAAKLTASTSSAQMLSYVLSSLASEGVIGKSTNEPLSSNDYPPEKRARHENEPYIPTQSSQQPQPPYQPSDVTTTQLLAPINAPPLPSSPPPMAPLPPPTYSMPPYIPTAGPMNGLPYGYGTSQQQQQLQPPLQGFSPVGTSMTGIPPFQTNSYQSYQSSEGNRYTQQPSSMPMAPMSRQ